MQLDDIAKFKRSYRTAFLAALAVITVTGMYNWIVNPHTNALFAAQHNRKALEKFADKNRDMGNIVEAKKQELEKLKEEFSRFSGAFFTKKEAKEFFSDLQPISQEHGCMVNSLNLLKESPGGKKGDAGIVPEGAILSIYGTYGNIIRLLER